MRLRRPQREALEEFHKTLKTLPKHLSECTHEEIKRIFHESHPQWHFEGPCPEITYHLATGVGKTRLIGATMAYLHIAQESRHFAIITPRAEIIRKFIKECRPTSSKYIFFDRSLVEEPEVIDAETAKYFEPSQEPVFSDVVIWILTPQALCVTNSKLKSKTDHTHLSPVEYLKSLSDLIIFFDESHHLGKKDSDDSSVWRKEIRDLSPKLMFGTTASVGDGSNHNVIYSYDLKQCLNEHLYTKMVRIIAEKRDETMTDEDHDRMVLRYGLRRLQIKQAALEDYATINALQSVPKAVMLVCCSTKTHAEEVDAFLREHHHLRDSVLLVHSGLGQSRYLEDLLSLENADNMKRVVVNVSMLTEGWDVANVYVIVPLRAMASSTLVTQVMGRGLRLPFGDQVGMTEVDTLDVLCFGRETMQEICDQIMRQGFGIEKAGITVQEAPKKKDGDGYVPSKSFRLVKRIGVPPLRIPLIQMKKDPLDLSKVSIPKLSASNLRAFKIHDPRTLETLKERPGFERDHFINLVATGILRQCRYLSYQTHNVQVRALIESFLVNSGFKEGTVAFEPEKVVHYLKNHLDKLDKMVTPQYITAGGEYIIDLDKIEISVPGHFSSPIDNITLNKISWCTSDHKGIPICNWKRCVFEAVPFDTHNELAIAKAIDHSPEIKWWFRNLPKMIVLSTPAGKYSPDFAILLQTVDETILLEVKGEVFAVGEESDANVKKEAAKRWCTAMSDATSRKWTYWFLLDRDAERCTDFNDIKRYAEEPLELEAE